MSAPRPRAADYGLILLLASFWGGSFMLIKVAIETVPPITMTMTRVAFGAALFLVFLTATRRRLPLDRRTWGWALVAATFGLAVPFMLISWGEERIDSGLAAILMAGMPLMTLLLARFVAGDEPLTLPKLVGVGFGIAGLVILIGPEKLGSLGSDTVRQIAVVAASFCYAVNAIVMKRLSGQDPYAISAAIMLCATAMLVPAGLTFEAPWTLSPSGPAWLALLALGLLPTAAASLLTLAILRRQGAGFFSQINFFVPLFGVFWGFAFLSERPPASAFVALGVILAGVAISRGSFGLPRPLSTET